jgi:aryl-alcohol dehydrogenase-like predicted oxidoreductase
MSINTNLDLSPDSILNRLDPYVYGTMSLGYQDHTFDAYVAMAHYAMDRCDWFHTSHKYGKTFDVLAQAFRDRPGRRPKCIFKLSGDTVEEVRGQVERQIKALGVDQIHVGQLHTGGTLAADLISGGQSLDGLRRLKADGLVGAFTLEVHPWTSQIALDHLKGGHGKDIIEGFSFYFNPMQRFALNELYHLILQQRRPILAIRTVAGGPVDRQAARPESADDYMQKRSREILPLYRDSGYSNWTDFAMGYIFSQPNVLCTIGACSTPAHLDDYLSGLKQRAKPFDQELSTRIAALHTKWSQEVDAFAAPWTM